MANMMIVESPNKVAKIKDILGAGWVVMASKGHVRDLPQKELAVDLDNGYKLTYQYIPSSTFKGFKSASGKERIDKIKAAMKNTDMVYLATDPDREGEAISWHLKESLGLKKGEYLRVAFGSIDKKPIMDAISHARDIDINLVRAQEARRALDRLVGYTASGLVSRLLNEKLSAGRVQSPALYFVVLREREIRAFKSTTHYGARLFFNKDDPDTTWYADLITAPFLQKDHEYMMDSAIAKDAAAVRDTRVIDSKSGSTKEAPPPPFKTSTLMQAASVALRMDPEDTAKVSQKLFEGGHITYHRTDSVNFDPGPIDEIRAYAAAKGWPLPEKPRRFKAKESAQEGHEAIRPTHLEVESLPDGGQEAALYELIWKRAVACQMADAEYNVNRLVLEGDSPTGVTYQYKANGRVMTFRGWRLLTAKAAESDEENTGKKDRSEDNESGKVPKLRIGEEAVADDGTVQTMTTRPPTRYTKATLVDKLENEGIGRPSTYPAIMGNILKRGYIKEVKRNIAPTDLGEKLIDALVNNNFSFVNPPFTSAMEGNLDQIASGNRQYFDVVDEFWQQLDKEASALGGGRAAHSRQTGEYPIDLDPNGKPYPCPVCGKPMRRVKGSNGFFWSCSDWKATGCKGSMSDANGVPVARTFKDAVTDTCPVCGKVASRRESKNKAGSYFWACENRDHKLMSDNNGKPGKEFG